uniref:Mce/MlaD domain-containing protein n=1 Tax=Plocamium cartilagineum TaxID=31452 RepID=A0A1C9CHT0_PLOCA|nr:hypothetical protein Plocam_081 [Plocamium cartilagineum]AOM67917.1 hypothetical protein Plocam_081 [Plocamium cartilagineum]
MELNNSYGVKQGTTVFMRGIEIGYVKNIKINFNSVLILINIKSSNIFIPKKSIIETSQTGLLNNSVIDIIPLEIILFKDIQNVDLFSTECLKSKFLCHLNCVHGERGLNYDDLVRAATRISQRFDDPRFFNLFYLFLHNSIEISDDILSITKEVSTITSLLYYSICNFLLNHL